MGTEVEIDEDSMKLIDEYCRTRPAKPNLIIDRIAREFYTKVVKELKKNTALMNDMKQKVERVPEEKRNAILINNEHARLFKNTAEKLGFDPCDLLSWQAKMFIKAHGMKRSVELNKERNMDDW